MFAMRKNVKRLGLLLVLVIGEGAVLSALFFVMAWSGGKGIYPLTILCLIGFFPLRKLFWDGQGPSPHDASADDDFRVFGEPFEGSRLQATESISCDSHWIHATTIRSSVSCSVSAGAASASARGMPASKWLTMACGATHELARADAARPIATRAWRGRHSTRRFRG